ncbi:cell envelope integrity protein TolA [Psychromonas hadalis]|uniref:cell envelope integrity protein TolA n=1 Tax=Psychromonas hadalis TaxID=211669 RepID=UPI0003B32EDD|nr:cell envelope integrity protein TolA [Psychromonas hadalis]
MKNSTTVIAFVTALSLHLIVGGVLLMSMDFSLPKNKPKEMIVIKASVVNQKLFDDLAQKKADKVASEKRKIEQKRAEKARIKREKKRAEKKRKEVEAMRVKAEKVKAAEKKKLEERILFEKIVAAKALRAKKEAEKTKKIAEEKFKKQEEKRIKREQEEAKRIEVEKVAVAKALKEKRAKEAKIKADKEAKRKAEHLRQAELDKQMEAEFADSFSSAQSSKQLSEIARYEALIRDKISRNWQVEPSMKGKLCKLSIRLAPDGLVLSTRRIKGDEKVCASAERATRKAKTLPIPRDPEIAPQFRDFDITLEYDF